MQSLEFKFNASTTNINSSVSSANRNTGNSFVSNIKANTWNQFKAFAIFQFHVQFLIFIYLLRNRLRLINITRSNLKIKSFSSFINNDINFETKKPINRDFTASGQVLTQSVLINLADSHQKPDSYSGGCYQPQLLAQNVNMDKTMLVYLALSPTRQFVFSCF